MTRSTALASLTVLLILAATPTSAAAPTFRTADDGWVHALARYGEPKYPPGYTHFDYANPDAPKGGTLTLGNPDRRTSIDKLNPFSVKGNEPGHLQGGLVFETLCVLGGDEPMTAYGLLAERMKAAPDDSAITFRLDPRARFSNGDPVTAMDVRTSFELVTEKEASPAWNTLFTNVKSATVIDERTIRFDLIKPDRSALINLAYQLPVFSSKWGTGPDGKRKPVNQIVNEPLITSGPYTVAGTGSGRRLTLVRNRDYWARDLPVRKGFFNYDRIIVKYYLDDAVRFEAFKAGEFDLMVEYSNRRWLRQHAGRKYDSGQITKAELKSGMGQSLQGFYLNTRRALFGDQRVREALALAYDFGVSWRQSQGRSTEAPSAFNNTEFAARGEPSAGELALLAPYRDQLEPRVFAPLIEQAPDRLPPLEERLAHALDLLQQAGWHIGPDGMLHDTAGKPFEFEYLTDDATSVTEAGWQHNLERIGVRMKVRRSDFALVLQRLNNLEFDTFLANPGNFLLPLPSDLESFFGTSSADLPGTNNLAGVKDPVLDALIEIIRRAQTMDQLRDASRAFDRVLRSRQYVVPSGTRLSTYFARWNRIELPSPPLYFSVDTPLFHPLIWPVVASWARPAGDSTVISR